MLKKTAAIAVLVLMIASLFSGSSGRVQADAPQTMNDMVKNAYERQLEYLQDHPETSPPAPVQEPRRAVFSALQQGMSFPAGAFGVADGTATAGLPTDIAFAGVLPEGGVILTGQASSGGAEQVYTTMIVYMNDSRIRVPVPGMARDSDGTARPIIHHISGIAFEPGSLSIDGKVAMFKAGSAVPDMFDLRWENKQAVRFGERLPPAIFTARLVMPAGNGSVVIPEGFPGEYVLDSDLAVDLANLTFEADEALQDSVYNNEISAGETRWHSADISAAVKSVNVDLKWSDEGHPMKLTIYTPDGHVLGPYEDSADGKADSRINLNVAGPSGVAAGEWSLKVTDTGGTGTGAYYVKTY